MMTTTNATRDSNIADKNAVMHAISRSKAATVLVLLFAGLCVALLAASRIEPENQIQAFGLLSICMFLLSLYASPQSKMPSLNMTASLIYSRIRSGELKIGYLERLCSLLSIAFGIAGSIGVYKTYF